MTTNHLSSQIPIPPLSPLPPIPPKQTLHYEICPPSSRQQFLDACQQGNLNLVIALSSVVNQDLWRNGFVKACDGNHECEEIIQWCLNHDTGIFTPMYVDSLSWAVRCACERGYKKILNIIFDFKSKQPKTDVQDNDNVNLNGVENEGMMGACKGGHLDIVLEMMNRGAYYWPEGMRIACLYGHLDIVLTFIGRGCTQWNEGMRSACEGGHLHIVLELIRRGANNFNSGFCGACEYGHHNIIEEMIRRGANDWNGGLSHACLGKQNDIARDMIQRGANDLNQGLLAAAQSGNCDMLETLIQNGADSFEEAMIYACTYGQMDVVERLADYGSKHIWQQYCACFQSRFMFRFVNLWMKKEPNAIMRLSPRVIPQLLNVGISSKNIFRSSVCEQKRKQKQKIVQLTLDCIQHIYALTQIIILPSVSYE